EADARLGITPTRPAGDLTPGRIWMAVLPYLLVITVFGIAKLWTLGFDLAGWLASTNLRIPWPGLDGRLVTAAGEPITGTVYSFQW
ncbi:L-lactate permease, partial [Xanthomonas citri pv. citri]|nr:L-lactate permease [Xanthomonas citri pv. citri]